MLHRKVFTKIYACHAIPWVFEKFGQQIHSSNTKQIENPLWRFVFKSEIYSKSVCSQSWADNEKSSLALPTHNSTLNSRSLSTSQLQPAKRALCFACDCTEVIYFLIGNGDAQRAEPCHTWGSYHYREQKLLPAWLSCHPLGGCDSSENGAYPIPVSSRIESVSNPCLLRENNGKDSWGRKGGEPLPWNSGYWAP